MNIVQFEFRAHEAGYLFWCAAEYADTYEEKERLRGLGRIFDAMSEIAGFVAPEEIETAAMRDWSGPEDR